MSTRRRCAGIRAAAAMLLMLTGCSVVGDIWATKDANDSVVFAVCDDFEASELRVRVQGVEGAAWTASGQHDFAPNETFSYGVDPSGLSTTSGPLELEATDTVVVSIMPEDQTEGSSIRGVFDLDEVNSGDCLAADGRTAEDPCT